VVKYKTLNIKESDYNLIREYCNNNALKISEWATIKLKQVIENEKKEKR